jgi:hypothetical protein
MYALTCCSRAIMRSAIDRDADPQQMIPKLTCLLLTTGQAEFSELVQLRDESK